jgi:ATP-dependent RNA helicase DeaD
MGMEPSNIKEEQLINSLKLIFAKEEFVLQKQLIQRLSAELQVSDLDCAVALSLLNQVDLIAGNQGKSEQDLVKIASESSGTALPKQKLVRYRLDIGRNHSVSIDDLKSVLIEVSGVDKNRIGRLDVRNYYSLVDLPDGMPADIFQLLAEVEIGQRKLNLKRVKYQPRFYRRNNKK